MAKPPAFAYVVLYLFCLSLNVCAQTVSVKVDSNGSYTVNWKDGTAWLRSAPTFFIINNATYSTADQSLVLLGMNNSRSSAFSSTDMYYSANGTVIVASVDEHYGGVYYGFRVTFPQGAQGTIAASRDDIVCGFPGFEIPPPPASLAYLSFGGSFMGARTGKFETNSTILLPGLLDSGPLVFFDKTGNGIVIGPSDAFMTSTMWQDGQRYVYWGITGLMTQLPAGFKYNILLYGSQSGVGSMMSEWAMVLLSNITTTVSTKRAAASLGDTGNSVLGDLGYWTGPNSAYYSGPDENQTYEATLISVRNSAINKHIPYGYVELDTWWYQKDAGNMTSSWTSPGDVLPGGLAGLYSNTSQWPTVASCGQWAKTTPYATQNGGKYNFTVSSTCSLPNDQAFWDDLFKGAASDGVRGFIQYNMAQQYECMAESGVYDVNIIPGWLDHLYVSAKAHDLDLIYSGAIPRLTMAATVGLGQSFAVQMGSGKFADPDHWKVGVSSILARAFRLRPFIGGIKSYTDDNDPSTQLPPRLYNLLATLSGGPVAYGDRMSKSDNLIVTSECCMENGTILTPLHPAMAIDAQLQQMAWGGNVGAKGEVWTTFTGNKLNSESNNFFSGIIMAADLQEPFTITPTSAGFTFVDTGEPLYRPTKIFAHDNHQTLYDFTDDKPFTLTNCTLQKFCLYHVAPVVKFKGKDLVIMGDLDKWVPMSSQRIDNIQMTSDKITITTRGQKGERLFMYFHDENKVMGYEHFVESDDGIDHFVYEEGGNFSIGCKCHAANYVIILCALSALLLRHG